MHIQIYTTKSKDYVVLNIDEYKYFSEKELWDISNIFIRVA